MDKSAEELLHDLKTHQAELEIQNDELRRAQGELETLQLRYSRLFERAPVGYVILDPNGIILQSNQKFSRLINRDVQEIKGKAFASLLREEDEPIFRSRFKALLRKPEGKEMELRFMKHPRGTFCGSVEALPHQSIETFQDSRSSEDDELLITITDITRRKTIAKNLEDALEEKQSMFKELQHRAKNSFSLISSLISLKLNQCGDPVIIGILTDLRNRVSAMADLYNLLYQKGIVDEVNVGEYLKQISRSLSSLSPDVEVKTVLDPLVFPVKEATSLGLILTELLSNAYKYAFPHGSRGRIDIRLSGSGDTFSFEVTDNGRGWEKGVPPEKPSQNGGLGMSLISVLCEDMGGRLERGSLSDKAGTFTRITAPMPG